MSIVIYTPAWGNTTGMYPILLTGFGVIGLNGVDKANHVSKGVLEIPVTGGTWQAVVDLSYRQQYPTAVKATTSARIAAFAPIEPEVAS